MPKILKDSEMINIIRRAPQEIDGRDRYSKFLKGLAVLITEHFGGVSGYVDYTAPGGKWEYTCGFRNNANVPDDGGVFRKYDTGVIWRNGRERYKGCI
ncbi:MAG: hypothetical protein WAX69_22280 [Victivallales bacterium]